jgi:hypothetical protein
MARRNTNAGWTDPKDNTFSRPGLVVDIGPDGEIIPRWVQVSVFTPVARGTPSQYLPLLQLGLAAN